MNIRNILTLSCGIALTVQISGQTLVGSAGGMGSTPGATITWSVGEPLVQSFSTSSMKITQGFQQPSARYDLFGQLTYANAWSTPLSGFPLSLHPLSGTANGMDVTNTGGWFYVYDLDPGAYVWGNSSALPVGSINATDALLVMLHFVNTTPLTGIWQEAGDVDASGGLNANDALMICRFFTDSITALPSGAWLVEKDTFSFGTTTQQRNTLALCYGDVNGSFIPSSPYKRSVWLQEEGELPIEGPEDFLIPIYVKEEVKLGAISLVLEESKGILELTGMIPAPGKGVWAYSVGGHNVKLAWYSTDPVRFRAGDVIGWVRARLVNPQAYMQHSLSLRLGPESELSDGMGEPYEHLELFTPRLIPGLIPESTFVGAVFPNPASHTISLRTALVNPARLRCGIYDIQGKRILDLPDQIKDAGIHELSWDVRSLCPGTYYIDLRITDGGGVHREVRKFIVMNER